MSLYLKYRPRTFDDIVGQHHIIDILRAQMQSGKFSHNYLFYGPRGTGKTSAARLLAKAANLTTGDFVNDPAAMLIDMGQTLDFVEIDAASHTGVDNIREEIIDKALYPPSNLKKKVYVIDEVHMLSKGAFNALLKIMEEPPHYLLFILATTEINKVPDTIISRCQVFNFMRVTIDDIVTRLALIAEKEGIEYEDEGLRLIAKLSSGALRDAIKYLEQVSMLGKVTAASVTMFLGAVSESVLNEFISLIKAGNPDEIFSYLDAQADGGVDLTSFAKDILLWLDEHFMEDVPFSVGLAQAFKEIVVGVKNYPYPLIVYKTVLRNYLSKVSGGASESMSATSKAAKPAKPTKKEMQKTPENSENPVVKDKGIAEKETLDNKASLESSTNKSTTSETSGVSKEELSVKDASTKTSKPTPAASDASSELGYDDIMQELIARTDGTMIKSILKKNTIVDSLNDGVLSLIVINEQYFEMIQKPEISSTLQENVSAILNKPTTIKRLYMSKEDWLARALV